MTFFIYTVKILKIGKTFSYFAFANSLPYWDMWLRWLSRHHTTPIPLFKIYMVRKVLDWLDEIYDYLFIITNELNFILPNLVDIFTIPIVSLFLKIFVGSWTIVHPRRHPGTKNLFANPPTWITGIRCASLQKEWNSASW